MTTAIAVALPVSAAASTGGAAYPGGERMPGGHAPSQAAEQPAAPPASAASATLLANGMAKAPAGAPAAVRRAVRLGNRLQGKPYRFGGGHGRWEDTGYDCSGASSYVLRGLDGLRSPLNSGGFMRWGAAGTGRWITVYANPEHMYLMIAGLRLDTGSGGQRGPRWRTTPRPPGAFTARHPSGL